MVMSSAAYYLDNPDTSSISKAYKTSVSLFGKVAGDIPLITLLSSGIASSVTGTLSG
jgi:manganese transport protein